MGDPNLYKNTNFPSYFESKLYEASFKIILLTGLCEEPKGLEFSTFDAQVFDNDLKTSFLQKFQNQIGPMIKNLTHKLM